MKSTMHLLALAAFLLLGTGSYAQNCCSKRNAQTCDKKEQAAVNSDNKNASAAQQLPNCPLAGTPECPLIKNCPKKGTADCPYTQQEGKQTAQKAEEEVPACCKKRKGNP